MPFSIQMPTKQATQATFSPAMLPAQRRDEQDQADEVEGDGGPDPRHQAADARAGRSRGSAPRPRAWVGVVELGEQLAAEQEHVDDHRHGHDHAQREDRLVADVVARHAPDDLEGEDHQRRPGHERRGQEPRRHQRMMPVGAARQPDVKKRRDRVNAHRPHDGDEHKRDVEQLRRLACRGSGSRAGSPRCAGSAAGSRSARSRPRTGWSPGKLKMPNGGIM